MPEPRLSRRRAVQLSGSLFAAGLAGCPADPNGAETATQTEAETGGDTSTASASETATRSASRTTTGGTPATETVETATEATGTADAEPAGTRTRTASTSASVTPAVSASDQPTDGETVTVGRVAVDRPGWLVVHPEADGGPDATTYLAAAPLDPGRHTDLRVTLNRPLEADRTLYAMLHYDDPADGNFTFAPGRGDDPPVAAGGETVVDSFRATVT